MSIRFLNQRIGFGALVLVALVSGLSAQAQTAEEIAFAKAHLDQVQEASLRRNREFCGLYAYDRNGKLVATPARRGRKASCRPRNPDPDLDVFASYHTHGAYDAAYENEVPSVDDVEGDMEEDTYGFIATPGGRLWFIDKDTGVSRQLCGIGCLLSDPDFEEDRMYPVKDSYTLDDLIERHDG